MSTEIEIPLDIDEPIQRIKKERKRKPKINFSKGKLTKEKIADDLQSIITYIDSDNPRWDVIDKNLRAYQTRLHRILKIRDGLLPRQFNYSKYTMSDEFYQFFGLEEKLLFDRPTVIRMFWKYIKDNGLQLIGNKRKFIVDEKLSKLLGLENGIEQLIFATQSKLSPHFKEKLVLKIEVEAEEDELSDLSLSIVDENVEKESDSDSDSFLSQ